MAVSEVILLFGSITKKLDSCRINNKQQPSSVGELLWWDLYTYAVVHIPALLRGFLKLMRH
jgi:hypothetical protein